MIVSLLVRYLVLCKTKAQLFHDALVCCLFVLSCFVLSCFVLLYLSVVFVCLRLCLVVSVCLFVGLSVCLTCSVVLFVGVCMYVLKRDAMQCKVSQCTVL